MESREFHFIKFVDDLTFRRIFPGPELISSIFDLILTYDNTDNPELNIEMLKQCSNVLFKILKIFPPCMHGLKEIYFNIINGKINSKILRSQTDDKDSTLDAGGLLNDCIALLDVLMDRNENDTKPDTKTESTSKNYLNYYHTWEKHTIHYEEVLII